MLISYFDPILTKIYFDVRFILSLKKLKILKNQIQGGLS